MPEFRPGESGPHEPSVRRGETTPPKPYTEGSLLGAMETAGKLVDDEELKEALKERGLGTPATRASIIETLLERGYIAREKKALAATDLGRYLVALVQDRGLKSPELTGEWEAKLREIERGRLDPRRFMARDRPLHRRDHPLGRPGRDRPEPARRLPALRPAGDRGQAGLRLLRLAGRLPVRALAGVPRPPLGDDQIRELLQRRVLLRPLRIGGSGEVVLHLTDSGDADRDPGPDGRPNRTFGNESGTPRSRRGKSATREARDRRGPRRRRASQPSRSAPARSARPRSSSARKSYGCSGWRSGCQFTIWKTIAGKRISVRAAQALLKQGRSQRAQGVRVEVRQAFDARLEARRRRGPLRFRHLNRPIHKRHWGCRRCQPLAGLDLVVY